MTKFLLNMKYLTYSLVLIFSFPVYSSGFGFWVQSAYTDEVTTSKSKKAFEELGNSSDQIIIYRASSTVEELIANIEHVDLVLWGESKELENALSKYKYNKILKSSIQVDLYKSSRQNITQKNSINIGVLKLSTAKKVANEYYKSNAGDYKLLDYDNYYLALKALYKGDIDYIAATNTLPAALSSAALSSAALKTVSRVFTFPKKGTIVVLTGSKQPKIQQIIEEYFISKSLHIGKYFGTGEFTRVDSPYN